MLTKTASYDYGSSKCDKIPSPTPTVPRPTLRVPISREAIPQGSNRPCIPSRSPIETEWPWAPVLRIISSFFSTTKQSTKPFTLSCCLRSSPEGIHLPSQQEGLQALPPNCQQKQSLGPPARVINRGWDPRSPLPAGVKHEGRPHSTPNSNYMPVPHQMPSYYPRPHY
jgi:hypothetical protein